MITPSQVLEVQDLVKQGYRQSDISRMLGLTVHAVSRATRKAVANYVIEQPPHYDDVKDIIAHKKKIFTHKKAVNEYEKLINITIKDSKPIAVCMIGDPHIDDDGCDIISLENDLNVISKTDGMYAGHLGDLTNNWVGRLARLYANQSTTAEQGVKLTEWMLNKAPNLFVIGGNHDLWNDGMRVIDFIMRQHNSVVQANGARIALNFKNGKQIRINAKHTFTGHSQFNPNHGHRKETLWGYRDHILVCGHKHVDGVGAIPSNEGLVHWMFQVSGYKVIDDYAKEHGFHEQRMGAAVTLILNPNAKCEAEIVKPFWDTEAAADYLNYLRK